MHWQTNALCIGRRTGRRPRSLGWIKVQPAHSPFNFSAAFAMTSTDMAPAPIFSYSPLKDASTEIRLLRISLATDSDHDDIVSVHLEHFRKGKNLVYDALSYTWGDASKTKTILVNGCQFDATENLHAALLQLRGFKQSDDYRRNELIWIDALCINQKDDNEKSLQVQMMRDIFSEAAQVIVWLGIPEEESHLGMETMASLVEAYNDYRSPEKDDTGNATAHYDKLLVILKDFLSRNHESKGDLTKSIRHIFQMPWWDRVWIIQEVAVARRAWVLFGSDTLGFEYFKHLYSTVNELEKIPDSDVATGWSLHINQISACTNRVHSVLRTWLNDDTTLLEALKALFVSGYSQATNPRDKFYALIGLRVDVEAMVGKVDYSMPWQNLYTKAARALLREHGLVVLSFCAPSRERQQNDLPSWVPDWTQYIPFPLAVRSSSKMYSVCGNTSQPVLNGDGTEELTLLGTHVAKIHKLRDPWPLPPATHSTYPWESGILAMKAWNQSIRGLASSLNLPDSKQDEIVMRTTSADLFDNEVEDLRRLGPDDKPAYEAFLRLVNLPLPSDPNFSYEDVSAADAEASGYYTGLLAAAETRRPFKTDTGHLGIAPEAAEVGDIICIFHGALVPIALRPEANGRYRLLGEAYVDGIMDGQFMDTVRAAEKFVTVLR